MKTTLGGSRIDDRAEPKPDCDATFMRAEIKDAVKRVERSFDASKSAVADTLEEAKVSAERLLKHCRETAEGYLDDATYQVRQNPWATVALAFGAGAIAGVLFGLLAPRDRKLEAKSPASAQTT